MYLLALTLYGVALGLVGLWMKKRAERRHRALRDAEQAA